MTYHADSAGRNDTHSQPHVDRPTGAGSSGTTGESSVRDASPRAAGAAPTRGAQPSGQRAITVCCYCRKRVYRVRNGEWYHERGSSTSCKPGEGSDRRATPLEIRRPGKGTS